MRILITGATGLIGSNLVDACHEKGIEVHYLTTQKSKIVTKANYKCFYWNTQENYIDPACIKGVDTIVHLAGATIANRWTVSYKEIILNSRIQTAHLLYSLLASSTHQVKHFVSASGISIYPPSLSKLYSEESVETDSGFLGKVTVAWEASVDVFKDLGMDVAKVRTGVVFDKAEGAFPKLLQPIKLGASAPVGSGNQWMSWIHIDDLVSIYMKIINENLEGVYNAVAPSPVTNKKLTTLIAKKLKKSIWLPNVPSFVLKIILGEMATLVLDGQLVSSKKIVTQGFQFQYDNIPLALEELLA